MLCRKENAPHDDLGPQWRSRVGHVSLSSRLGAADLHLGLFFTDRLGSPGNTAMVQLSFPSSRRSLTSMTFGRLG